jgi:hypothetical protein
VGTRHKPVVRRRKRIEDVVGHAPKAPAPLTRPSHVGHDPIGESTSGRDLLGLQRVVGNRTAIALYRAGQAKVEVGPAGDAYEQEADRVAEVVAQLRSPRRQAAAGASTEADGLGSLDGLDPVVRRAPVIRRVPAESDGGSLDAGTEQAIRAARGGGVPLSGEARRSMEGAFGADFGRVRLHEGPGAAALNDQVQAKAFTIGTDIFFRRGIPDASSGDGQSLLAHELTNTIQQGGSPSSDDRLQRMPTRTELVAEVGAPKADKRLFGLKLRKMSTRYKALLDAIAGYDAALAAPIALTQAQRAVQAATFGGHLATVTHAATTYLAEHQGTAEARSPRLAGLATEAGVEQGTIATMTGDAAYNAGPVAPTWRNELKRRQFEVKLASARQSKAAEGALRTQLDDIFNDPSLSPQQRRTEKARTQGNQELANKKVESSYIDAVGLLESSPDMIQTLRTRDLVEALVEANRRASIERLDEAESKVDAVAGLAALHTRIQSESVLQDGIVATKVAAVKAGLRTGTAQFTDLQLEQLTGAEENLALLSSVVNNSLTTRGLPVPTWVEWTGYRCGARVQSLVRAYRQVSPNVPMNALPRALTAPYTLLGPSNPLADWVKPVFREGGRATGEAVAAVDRARAGAASRADDDYTAALDRLQNELGVDASEVEDLLKRSLLVLARARLTVNLNHQKLKLVLTSGGFKNYWQVTPALAKPADTADPADKQKYDYQQTRLETEGRLFGGTRDLTTKGQKSAEQPISTAANVFGYELGAAPSRDYGRSVAVLRDSVKQRATYTPWDALDLMKRIDASEGLVGPEVVATHDNLAAIIRYTSVGALKDIVKKAENPNMTFDNAMPAYIEAQIHGPLEVRDIERVTISLDDLEDNVYDTLYTNLKRRITDQEVSSAVDVLKLQIEGEVQAAGIDVSFSRI